MSLEMLDLPHDVTGLALNLEDDNVGVVLFGDWRRSSRRHRQAHQHLLDIPSARSCSAAWSTRSAARSTTREHQHHGDPPG